MLSVSDWVGVEHRRRGRRARDREVSVGMRVRLLLSILLGMGNVWHSGLTLMG